MSLRSLYGYAGSLARPVMLYVGNQRNNSARGLMNGTPPVGVD